MGLPGGPVIIGPPPDHHAGFSGGASGLYYGLYLHEIGHVFFAASLLVFLCYIVRKKFIGERGWLYIAISAFAFILWNLLALLGGLPAGRGQTPGLAFAAHISLHGKYHFEIAVPHDLLAAANGVVFLAAVLFLYLGIRRHFKNAAGDGD